MATFLIIFIVILLLAICALMIVSNWIIFQKAGRPGWASIIPVYSSIVSLQVARLSPFLIFILLATFIPYVGTLIGLAFNIVVNIFTGKAFNKGAGFICGMIFLPIVFYPILAFGDSQYATEVEE